MFPILGQAVPQPQHAEIDRRTAGGGHAALREAAIREEKAKLPDMPATFLPAAVPEEREEGKRRQEDAASNTTDKDPEFVGPRGQQIPKQ